VTNLSFHLFHLQQLDLHLDQINTRLLQIDESLKNDKAVQDIKSKLKEKEAESAKVTGELAQLAEMAREKNIKVEQSNSSLYNGKIQNPKELGDLQLEIASLKNALTNLENQQFQKMLDLEKIKDDVEFLEKQYQFVREGWDEANEKLRIEEESLKKEKEKLLVEHKAITGQIPADQLIIYENLRHSKNRIAVTSVEEESCTICGSEITAALIQKAKSSTSLANCPSCGRILYTG
jgi:uncharacterized protein